MDFAIGVSADLWGGMSTPAQIGGGFPPPIFLGGGSDFLFPPQGIPVPPHGTIMGGKASPPFCQLPPHRRSRWGGSTSPPKWWHENHVKNKPFFPPMVGGSGNVFFRLRRFLQGQILLVSLNNPKFFACGAFYKGKSPYCHSIYTKMFAYGASQAINSILYSP